VVCKVLLLSFFLQVGFWKEMMIVFTVSLFEPVYSTETG
jgi:uncharacterized membrane protein